MGCNSPAGIEAKYMVLLDYVEIIASLIVNQACKIDTYLYPLATKDESFLQLATSGDKVFTKFDMSQTYLQLSLDDKSKKLVTINTHKGLLQYKQTLLWAISSLSCIS